MACNFMPAQRHLLIQNTFLITIFPNTLAGCESLQGFFLFCFLLISTLIKSAQAST